MKKIWFNLCYYSYNFRILSASK